MTRIVDAYSVATGRYLEFWLSLAADMDERFFPHDHLRITVFTDRANDARRLRLRRSELRIIPTPALRWPQATLLRYQLIASLPDVSSADLAVHLDADMRVSDSIGDELNQAEWTNGLAFVRHPGYVRRPAGYLRSLRAPRVLVGEARMRLANAGSLGAWEEDPRSLAYVPRESRKVYVCGGVWFGSGPAFSELCNILAERTAADLHRDHVARWHDESHLNWYSAFQGVSLLGAEYCWSPAFSHMIRREPKIIAVDKGPDWTRRQKV